MATARGTFLAFAAGLCFGALVVYIVDHFDQEDYKHKYLSHPDTIERSADGDITHFLIHRDSRTFKVESPVNFDIDLNDTHGHHLMLNEVAEEQAKRIKVLCWVMTSPDNLPIRGKPVKETWGKRCNILLFMSSESDSTYPAIGLDVPEGHDVLWQKTRAAWEYVYDHHVNDADWFIKADDDTFVIVENLRHLVSTLSPDQPHYLGRYFKPFGGYNSGGAGYVFSRETLRRFKKALGDESICHKESFAEDVEVGKCLAAMGVKPGDTRDKGGRKTFMPLPPEHHLIPGFLPKDFWLWSYDYHQYKDGPSCCSDHAVTFHYIKPNMMYLMEYFVYHLRPYGMVHQDHER